MKQRPQERRSSFKTKSKSIMFFDSNRKYLDPSKLWRNMEVVPCGDIMALNKLIGNHDLTSHTMVAIHVGTNDVDKKDGATVFALLKDVVRRMTESAPDIKIVVNELTPRRDTRDTEVVICNSLLQSLNEEYENVTIATHSNLRVADWKFHDDDKHLSQVSIAKFASNIKVAFRKAYNIKPRKWSSGKGKSLDYGANTKYMSNKSNSEKDIINTLVNFLNSLKK